MSLKVGDVVRLRNNLKRGKPAGYPLYMEKYNGTEVTIKNATNVYSESPIYKVMTHEGVVQSAQLRKEMFHTHDVLDWLDHAYRYVAKDDNGSIWAFTNKPIKMDDIWDGGLSYIRLVGFEEALSEIITDTNKIYKIN